MLFNDGGAYETSMGTWSRLVGEVFIKWLRAEGNLKWTYLPHNERALSFATSVVDPSTGLINEACSTEVI